MKYDVTTSNQQFVFIEADRFEVSQPSAVTFFVDDEPTAYFSGPILVIKTAGDGPIPPVVPPTP